MFSRGKRMVELANKRIERDQNSNENHSSENDRDIEKDFSKDDFLDDRVNENDASKDDVRDLNDDADSKNDSSEDDFLDLDDDRDLDYIPEKKKKKSFYVNEIIRNVTRNEANKLPLACAYDSSDTSSETDDECTIPVHVMFSGDLDGRTKSETAVRSGVQERSEPNKRQRSIENENHESEMEIEAAIRTIQEGSEQNERTKGIEDETQDIVIEEQLHPLIAIDQPLIVDHEEIVGGNDETHESLRDQIINSTNVTKVKNKRLRMTGLSYKGEKRDEQGHKHFSTDRNERMLMPSKCSKRCEKQVGGRRCTELNQGKREEIFRLFWRQMDWKQKKVYVLSLVDMVPAKKQSSEDSRRKMSYKYHLRLDQERVVVCHEMFLSTLGIGDKMIHSWLKKGASGVPTDTNLEGLPDTSGRGKQNRENEEARETARQFLIDLPKLPSHYCRSSTSKEYLEPLFTSLNGLHTEYVRKMTEESKPFVKLSLFKILMNDMNISLYRPKKDLCDICCSYEAKIVTDAEYQEHIRRKNDARESKNKDKERTKTETNLKVVTVDLQSLLTCPKLNASCLYYKMKLSCHNYTVFDLATHAVKCYFWHECDGELTANIFTTCIIDYLTKEDLQGIDHVIIYSDGCGYQNKNATLSNALLEFARDKGITIEQKYLERGHTQMECDSVHSVIERRVRKQPIYVPQQYVDVMKNARAKDPYVVEYVNYTFFKDFSKVGKYDSIRPGRGVGSETVSSIRSLKYTKEGLMFYKTQHSDTEYKELPEPRSTRVRPEGQAENLYRSSLPLKRVKYNHLQQLKEVIPADYHGFYDSLPHCNG